MPIKRKEVEETCLALRSEDWRGRPDPHYVAAMLEAQQTTIDRLEQLLEFWTNTAPNYSKELASARGRYLAYLAEALSDQLNQLPSATKKKG